jgi:hypothetical protein
MIPPVFSGYSARILAIALAVNWQYTGECSRTKGNVMKLGFWAWNREVTRVTRIGRRPSVIQRLTAYRTYRSMP